jgi:dipeptidyl aminopeptidase/acylaminoacyl peptidase
VRVLLGVGVLATFLAIPADAAAPGGRIVFSREIGEQAELFSIRPDGSRLKRLTYVAGYDDGPAWSPNGRLIASFGLGGVIVRNADGSVVRRIAIPVEGFIEELQWSPDGRWLSYLVEHCQYEEPRGYVLPPCADLWVVRADGQRARRLLDREVDMLDDPSYAWSAGSRRLVYERLSTGPSGLAVVELLSGRHGRIRGTARSADPSWSPSAEIAFVRGNDLFTVRPTGHGLKRLAQGKRLARPVWSPDGRRLAYLADESSLDENRWGVWVVQADRRRRWRIGRATEDRQPVWSPDSKHLLWENFLRRLMVAPSNRPSRVRFLTRGSNPDWR